MADISKLARMVNGIPRAFNLTATDTFLNVFNVKITDSTGVLDSKALTLDAVTRKLVAVDIANAHISATAEIALSKLAAVTASKALVSDASGFITASSVTSTELGYVAGVTSSIQAQLDALNSGYTRRSKAISYITDNTIAPPTEVSGDRYILAFNGGAPHADYDGASAGDIVTFNGTVWTDETPAEGWVLYVDADNKDYLMVNDGTAAWEPRSVQSTALAEAKIWIGSTLGAATEQALSGDATLVSSGVITISANAVDGTKMRLANATYLRARNAAGDADISLIGADASDNIVVKGAANKVILENQPTGAVDLAIATTKYVKDQASKPVISAIVGEAFLANKTYVVRYAISGETVERVYKASSIFAGNDPDTAQKFWSVGIIQPLVTLAAGDAVDVIKYSGALALLSADTNPGAAVTDQGKPLYLSSTGELVLDPSAALNANDYFASCIVARYVAYSATVTSAKIAVESLVFSGVDYK
jgi:hypothetical protein